MNARRARERRREEKLREAKLVGSVGPVHELWRVGNMLVVAPRILEPFPDELKAALLRRREAAISGRCACGVGYEFLAADAENRINALMAHESSCSASDDALAEIGRRHGITIRSMVPSIDTGRN